MKKLALLFFCLPLLVPAAGYGQGGVKTYVAYQDTGYRYLIAKKTDKVLSQFYKWSYDDSPWQKTAAAAGTLNNTDSPPCPFNDSVHIKLFWPSSREVLLRKVVKIDPGVRKVTIGVAIDNGVQVFLNGIDVSGGILIRNGCASLDNVILNVHDSVLTRGVDDKHLLAVRGNWQSSKNYLDVRLSGELPYVITTKAGTGGTISPPGPVYAYKGESKTFGVQANPAFHVATVLVSGKLLGGFPTSQPASTPSTLPYTFTSIQANDSIQATFDINYYFVVARPADASGSVSVENPSESPFPGHSNPEFYKHGTTLRLRARASSGYYFSGWTVGANGSTASLGSANPLDITMARDTTVTANFSRLPDAPTVYTVTSNLDSRPGEPLIGGSLRDALKRADSLTPGTDIIQFSSTLSGPIQLYSPLPAGDQVIFNGGTSGGLIVLEPASGFSAGSGPAIGLELSGVFLKWGYTPKKSTITGLRIQNFPGAGLCIQSDSNRVEGCVITANAGDGICILDGTGNTVGGTQPAQRNIIYANGGNGVVVKRSPDSTKYPSGNGILGNSIYGNGKLGIDLGGSGVTRNRYPDLPPPGSSRPLTAVNYGQAFPDLYYATLAGPDPASQPSFILGKLYGWPQTKFRVEIFLSDSGEASGNGEGKTLIGVGVPDSVVTDATGIASFVIQSAVPLRGGESISATATDDANNTSEFSANILAGTRTRIYGATDDIVPSTYKGRFVVNTTYAGIPLHWPDGKASYRVSENVPPAFAALVDPSFGTWNAITGLPNAVQLGYANDNKDNSTTSWGGTPDGVNNIVWVPSGWQALTGAPNGAIAVTRVRYDARTGRITDGDIALNAERFVFENYPVVRDGREVPPDSNMFDFRAILTHEIGHFGGLADYYNRGDPYYNLFMGADPCEDDVTMYGIFNPSDTFQREIHHDDEKGMEFVYGFVPRAQVEVVLAIDGSSSFADFGTYNGFEPSKFAALELVDKMRDGDWISVTKLSDPVPVVEFTQISPATRLEIKLQISNKLVADATDTRPLGTGLQTAAQQLSLENSGRQAIILFSAGNETESPSALDPAVLASLGGISVYTMGFAQSPSGADLTSTLADSTGGAFYEAADTSISTIVNQIWDNLAGFQLIGDSTMPSNAISYQGQNAISWQGSAQWNALSWQGTNQLAISWQGAIDQGTSSILPAISWQGKSTTTSLGKGLADAGTPKFHLALITPDFVDTGINWNSLSEDPPGTITPATADTIQGVQYVEGPTYAFYVISSEYRGKKNGFWKLLPVGANSTDPPFEPMPVVASLTAATDVVMDVSFDKSSYALREPVRVRVTLMEGGQVLGSHTFGGGPINTAQVYADVSIPGAGITERVLLTLSGNGVYSGTFLNTLAGGTYSFAVFASGVTSLQQPFTRHLEQAVFVVPAYSSAVMFAQDSVTIADNSRIVSGDVLVNRDAQTGDAGAELRVGAGTTTPAGFSLKADRVLILGGAVINSDVYYNELTNYGVINGTWQTNTPLALPLGAFPPFEPVDPRVATAANISIGNGAKDSLKPGIYGDVVLQPHASLTLKPGGYHFKSLWAKSDSRVYTQGATRVHLRNGLSGDNGSFIGTAAAGASVDARDVVFYVQGTNAESNFSLSVNISPKSTVFGTVFAPNGTLYLNQETHATGAFLAKDIRLGQGVQLTLASAFGSLARPSARSAGGDADERSGEGTPKTFALLQNYPNPFNPTTQIRFALPRQSDVRLSIYDVLGREVTRLVDEIRPEGVYEVQWNGLNSTGMPVGTGIYFYEIRAGDFVQIRKMILLK